MAAKYTMQLTADQLKAIVEDPERTGLDVPTVVGTDNAGNQLPSINIHILGPVEGIAQVETEAAPTNDEELEMDTEEEEVGNVAPEEAEAEAALGFDSMTESRISSFNDFLKRK